MVKVVENNERICTVTLDGSESSVVFQNDYKYFAVKNESDADIYLSLNRDIVEGADGVMTISSKESALFAHMKPRVNMFFVKGTGKIQVFASNEPINPFVVAPDIGGVEAEISELKQDLSDFSEGGKKVSGESAYTIENAVDYPLIGLNLYGKSTQDGTPTPENPVEIVSVENPTVTVCGKNLLNATKKTTTINGVTFTNNGDGTYTLNGTSSGRIEHFRLFEGKIKLNGTYKLNGFKSGSYSGKCVQFYNEDWTSVFGDFNGVKDLSGYYYCRIYITAGLTFNNEVVKPMLTTDLTATYDDFEPYNGTTANITTSMPLCGIPVESGGNYTDSNGQQWICDTLEYNADGSGKITKRTAKIDSYNGETITTPYISTTGDLTTGATVIYQIAEPQEIEMSAAEMTALRELQTYNGITNISNDGGADMSVGYCTNKMLSEYVMPITTGLQKQIDELKAAVLSLGGNV